MTPLSPQLLVPAGKGLLLGTFAACLVQAIRGKTDLTLPFERVAIGLLALAYFTSGAAWLDGASGDLAEGLQRVSGQVDLRALILDAFRRTGQEEGPGGPASPFNLPAVIEQAWRTGVWGVMSAVVEGAFLIASFVLECAREVLWKLLLLLFPLAVGVYPLLPRMMTNLILYAFELALWFPMLVLVEGATGVIARERMVQAGSWGLTVVAIQLIAIILILAIPGVTHRFLGAAFSGDFDSQSGLFLYLKRVVHMTRETKGRP